MGPTFINGFYDEGLGDIGLGAWTTTVGQVGQAAGATAGIAGGLAAAGLGAGTAAGAALGSVVPVVGTVIGALAGLISGIFGQHQQKVALENKVSGQWAAAGPQTINQVIEAWQQGQIDGPTANSALDSIYQQFLQMNQGITKYNGTTGAYPDPNSARPSSNCNWACGTSWDLNQEIQGLKTQIGSSPGTSLGLGSLTSNPLLLIGGAALLLVLLSK